MVDHRSSTITPHRPASVTSRPTAQDVEALEQRVASLQRALDSSRQIGAATGILMARQGWSYEDAFEWLRRASQTSNRKVVDLADEIVLTGTVEAPPGPGDSRGRAGSRPS